MESNTNNSDQEFLNSTTLEEEKKRQRALRFGIQNVPEVELILPKSNF